MALADITRKYRFIKNGEEVLNLLPDLDFEAVLNSQSYMEVAASSTETLRLPANVSANIIEVWVDEGDEGTVDLNINGNTFDLALSPRQIFSGTNITAITCTNNSTTAKRVYWNIIYG